jgi:hypothetical protein
LQKVTSEKAHPSTLLGSFVDCYFRSRRLEDRIRELCALAVAATEASHLTSVLDQLSTALHQQVDRLRMQASERSLRPERRQSRS